MTRKSLVFASNNAHKLEEVRQLVGDLFEIKSLADINCSTDIPETADTLEGNAFIKARYVKEHYGLDCFADDTGLEIEALNNEPGVYSARYAGEGKNSEDNMNLVLSKMEHLKNRKARFRTAIALILDGEEFLFEGIVPGEIATERSGEAGFGYDPIFRPEGDVRTFAQMPAAEKNAISHRGRALQALMNYLKSR